MLAYIHRCVGIVYAYISAEEIVYVGERGMEDNARKCLLSYTQQILEDTPCVSIPTVLIQLYQRILTSGRVPTKN